MTEISADIWTLKTTPAAQLVAMARSLEPGPSAAVVSTCTRVELYGDVEPPLTSNDPREVLRGRDALDHLAAVAARADSLVVGETDVLAQVRAAFARTSDDLRAFGDAAIAAGREARRRAKVTLRDAGHQLDIALQVADCRPPHSVNIMRTGAMAGHLARRARELGSENITVTGRNFRHAQRCASDQAEAIRIEALPASAEQGCLLILAHKDAPAPTMREAIVRAADRASLVIDLTMPPFDWQSDQPRHVVDLQSMVREFTPAHLDPELQHQLAAAARPAIQRQWEHRYATGAATAARLYRRVEELRQREVARTAERPDANPEALDVVAKALVKRLFHRYAESLRQEQEPALIAVIEELFAFDTD